MYLMMARMEHDLTQQTSESIDRLQKWIALISPQDLQRQLAILVTHAPSEHKRSASGDSINLAEERARSFAEHIVREGKDLSPFLRMLVAGDQKMAFAFGRRLGEMSPNPEEFISRCLAAIEDVEPSNRNPTILAAFLYGLQNEDLVESTLEKIVARPSLVGLLVPLTRLKPTIARLERVNRLIVQGAIPPDQLRQFAYGMAIAELPSDDVVRVLKALIDVVPAGRHAIFEVLSMYVLHSESKWGACRALIRHIVISTDFVLSLNSTMDSYHWEQAVCKLLDEQHDGDLAVETTRQILKAQMEPEQFSGDVHHRHVLRHILERYPEQTWPLIGAKLLDRRYYRLQSILGSQGFTDHQTSLFWNVPQEVLIGWVRQHPEALPRIIGMAALFTVDAEGEYRWHPLALALFEQGLTNEAVGAVRSNLFSYGSTGSRVRYIDRRIRLLRQLADNNNAKVREMAKAFIAAFEQDRVEEKKADEEFRAGIL